MGTLTKTLLALCAATALIAGACSAKGDEEGSDESTTETSADTAEPVATDTAFGDLESPCGAGDFTVDPEQSGGSTDTLRIGVPNDRTSQIRPGLNKELWDTSVAFAAWCNEQGGIGGLPIELVDIDGKVLEVESAMAAACNSVFMLVGGGQTQDNLQFSGKAESDFHECGLAEIPGFTVSPEKSESNGQVQPVPHPAGSISSAWLHDLIGIDPDATESMAEVWGELPSMGAIKNQTLAIMENEGVTNAGVFTYPVTGLSDWTPLAQQIIGSGATSMHFVGEPTNLGSLVNSLREQGWEGTVAAETNIYDDVYVESAGADSAAGTVIRSAYHPFEEADRWPAVQQYLDIMDKYADDPKVALLGLQSFSSWLLFATAANTCGESNDGELTRACVLEAAAAIDDWTAGGLHVATDPGPEGGTNVECGMLLTVTEDGTFERLYPEIGSDDDAGDGFACDEGTIVAVPENEGLGVTSPNQPI